MTGEVPAYVLAPGREALSRRLESLAAAEVPVACGIYVNLAEPCEWSARHAEATYWIAYQLAHGSVPALPHFNTSPPPRLASKDHAFPLYETIARTHLSLGNPTAAIAATDRLTALSPNDARAWDIRGQAFLRAGRLHEAIEAYRRAIPIGGLPVGRAAFYLGWIHARLGRQEEALSYYRLSERIDPTVSALACHVDAVENAQENAAGNGQEKTDEIGQETGVPLG